MHKLVLYLKNFDWILLAAVVLLVCFGLAEIYSIALSKDDLDILNFKKQVLFVSLGVTLLFMFSFFDYYNWRSFSLYAYLGGIALLLGVLFFGKTVRGTTGWFDFGGMSLQPVEFAKFFLIIFLARYFSSVSVKANPLRHMLISGSATLIFVLLVLRQPDFGSALLIFAIWASMIFFAGFQKKYILIIIALVLIAFLAGWLFLFEDYQKDRIMTYLKPGSSSLSTDYNITQAIIAVGSGRLTGRGLGFGSQSQLKFLPEAQNDFIFACLAEELGFLGVILILGFFAVFYQRILSYIKKINNDFGIFFMLGLASLIFIEMFINIGMNIGLLPVVGISLPFLSYGGSAIISTLLMVGVAQNVIIRSKLKY